MLHRRNVEDVVINDEFLENWTVVSFYEALYAVESGISPITFWKGTELQQREKTESVVTWRKQLRYALRRFKITTPINTTPLRPTYC
jgi:hypothetical protein